MHDKWQLLLFKSPSYMTQSKQYNESWIFCVPPGFSKNTLQILQIADRGLEYFSFDTDSKNRLIIQK